MEFHISRFKANAVLDFRNQILHLFSTGIRLEKVACWILLWYFHRYPDMEGSYSNVKLSDSSLYCTADPEEQKEALKTLFQLLYVKW